MVSVTVDNAEVAEESKEGADITVPTGETWKVDVILHNSNSSSTTTFSINSNAVFEVEADRTEVLEDMTLVAGDTISGGTNRHITVRGYKV